MCSFDSIDEVHSTNTYSAQRMLIKTDKTERLTALLQVESQGYRHFLNKSFATALEPEPQDYRHILNTIFFIISFLEI